MISDRPRVLGFGEAMVRYAPLPLLSSSSSGRGVPSAASSVLRTVAGDELNVMVALSKIGISADFVTVLPGNSNSLASLILGCAADAGVSTAGTILASDTDICGTFSVIPEEKRVEYQRSASAFWTSARSFDWDSLLKDVSWVHATGITPMCGSIARTDWKGHIEAATRLGVQLSLDLNHRPALGTLLELWSVAGEYISKGAFRFVILSRASVVGLARILGVADGVTEAALLDDVHVCMATLRALRDRIGAACSPLCCCLKRRDWSTGVQTRWSVMVGSEGDVSSIDNITTHVPKDECGGGSAWAAGMIDSFLSGITGAKALRRADSLAALCQNVVGDHSDASRADLNRALASPASSNAMTPEAALDIIAKTGVVAILRTKNAELALKRAIELADMGCGALEVTMDSDRLSWLLPEIVRAVGDRVVVGVGTVMCAEQVDEAASMGARFALSPINPKGFVQRCRARGIVSVPAAYSPQEIFDAHNEGADLIKLFPAQLWSASTLKALKAVGDFGSIRILPSGGITRQSAIEWLKAGAFAVGMGSCLTGKDIKISPSDDGRAMQQAADDWKNQGKKNARMAFSDAAACVAAMGR